MKKVLFAFIALALVVSVGACKKADVAQPAAAEKPATVATEPAKPDFKIGLVFDVGGKGDRSFNDSAYAGLVHIGEEFKGFIASDKIEHGKQVELKYLEPKPGGQDRENLVRVLAEEGYDLIFGIGFMFSDVMGAVAKDFPDTHFGLIDGFVPDLTKDSNVTCLAFDEHVGSFLAGAVATKLADGGKIGFLGGMDIPLIHKFQGGFMAGIMYSDAKYRAPGMILSQYIGKDPTAFNDPKAGESISVNMYNQGATVIYHAAGGSGNGLFKAAKDMDKIAIGVDSDQGLIYATSKVAEERAYAKHIATSMLKRVDNAVFLTAKAFIEGGGKVDGGYRAFGIKDKGIDIAVNDYNKEVLTAILPTLDGLKKKIIDGKITVPDDDSKVADWAKGLK